MSTAGLWTVFVLACVSAPGRSPDPVAAINGLDARFDAERNRLAKAVGAGDETEVKGAITELDKLLSRAIDEAEALPGDPATRHQINTIAAEWALNYKGLLRELLQRSGRSRKMGGVPKRINLSQALKAMGPNAVLFQYVKMDYNGVAHYIVWICWPSGTVEEFIIGPDKNIDPLVDAMRAEIKNLDDATVEPVLPGGSLGRLVTADPFFKSLENLRKKLLPSGILQALSANATRTETTARLGDQWVISPAANLWLVPFAALPLPYGGDRQYAVSLHDIYYVISGREFDSSPPPATGPSFVAGDPDFDTPPFGQGNFARFGISSPIRLASYFPQPRTEPQSLPDRIVGADISPPMRGQPIPPTKCLPGAGEGSGSRRDGRGRELLEEAKIRFQRVPTTRDIAETIAQKFGVPYLVDRDASEQAFLDATEPGDPAPRYIGLSTHGFALGSNKIKDPLLKCGLALAGVNVSLRLSASHTLEQALVELEKNVEKDAKAGKSTLPRIDGCLTGREIAGRNLVGTELVLLIACKTAAGESVPPPGGVEGESIVSLRHAFTLAGAQAVVATTWSVDPVPARSIVADFLQERNASKDNAVALCKVQRKRAKTAHPYSWASFSLTGKPR